MSVTRERFVMVNIRRIRTALGALVAEDRPNFKRVDASPVKYDDGSWLSARA
jgi:hypothetical protein